MTRFRLLTKYHVITALLIAIASSPLSAQPLKPDILASKSYTEIFTLSLHGDDGTFVQAQFTLTNLGVEDGNAACKTLVLNPSAKPWKVNEKFTSKQWHYSVTPTPTLAIGNNTIKARPGSVALHTTVGGSAIDITLGAPFSSVKPPNADYRKPSSDKFYTFEILVPWTAAQAVIALPGSGEQTVSGYGTLERARSVGTSRDLCRGWITFRGNSGNEFFLANFRLPAEKNAPAEGWIRRNGDAAPVAMKGLDIRREQVAADEKKTNRWLITAADRSFTITGGVTLYRYSFVDELGAFTGGLVKLVIGKPITAYHTATARFSGGDRPVPGILEIMSIE
jgi:hypothetical protein